MEQDITALKQSFEKEYKVFLADDRGNREFRQGELFDKYRQLGISANDMAQIMKAVDSETHDKISKLESYVDALTTALESLKSGVVKSWSRKISMNQSVSQSKLLSTNSREKIQRQSRTREKSKFS